MENKITVTYDQLHAALFLHNLNQLNWRKSNNELEIEPTEDEFEEIVTEEALILWVMLGGEATVILE